MATDAKKNQPSKKSSRKPDDLAVIKGIGDSLKQWFRDSFKVHTFAEIAALSAHEVEARAKRDGRFLPLNRIEQILAQASELAEPSLPFAAEGGRRAHSKKENDWKEFAIFLVNFERKVVRGREKKRTKVERRTAIHHMETGEQESWSGVDTGEACRWMERRLSEQGELIAEEAARSTKSSSKRTAKRTTKAPIKRKAKTTPPPVAQPAEHDWQAWLPGAEVAPAPAQATPTPIREAVAPIVVAPTPAALPVQQPAAPVTTEVSVWQPLSPDQFQEMLMLSRSQAFEREAPKVEVPQSIESAPVETSTSHPVALEVTEVQVVQPSASNHSQELFADSRAHIGYVKAGEPLSFAVKFRLTGKGAAEVTKRNSPFSVVFNAENLFTSTVTRLGVSNPDFLRDGQFTYTALMSPLTVAPGDYYLRIVTTVRDPLPLWDSTEVPVLRVVP